MVTGGWVADRLLSAGRRDGALRTARWAVALLIPAAALVGMASDATVSLAALSVTTFFVAIPVGLTPVILYQFTPNEFRGQVIALNLLVVTVLGLALGPLLIASLTDIVFRDPHAVGKSLTVVTVFGAVSSLICLTVARRVTNRHVLVQYSTVGTE
jgi:MFS family permease